MDHVCRTCLHYSPVQRGPRPNVGTCGHPDRTRTSIPILHHRDSTGCYRGMGDDDYAPDPHLVASGVASGGIAADGAVADGAPVVPAHWSWPADRDRATPEAGAGAPEDRLLGERVRTPRSLRDQGPPRGQGSPQD